jgi:hypothetical protein
MDAELTLALAFLAGLAGAGHCWAMCGGLVGGLFVGRFAGGGWRADVGSHLGYHAGRVLAYTLLGALAAAIGQAIVLTGEVGWRRRCCMSSPAAWWCWPGRGCGFAQAGSAGCAARFATLHRCAGRTLRPGLALPVFSMD